MAARTHSPRIGARPARLGLVAAALLGLGSALAPQARAQGTIRILETGSSLLYPLFNLWVPAYQQQHPNVQITTQSTGSGTGLSEALNGTAQIGASDAYLSGAMARLHPGILNIPLAIASQMVNYNVPGLNDAHLKLSGPVLAGIYEGRITEWDDPQIAGLNPGVTLPHDRIIPVHRSDGSGDTFIFTQYLADSTPSWAKAHAYGTTISWPAVQGGIGAQGNQGMVNALAGNKYAIAYVGISYRGAIQHDRLGEAQLQNRAGKFVLPDATTVQAAASEMAPKTPADERISMIFAPGANSYPIVNYEYAIVSQKQPSPSVAEALRGFLSWAISPQGGGQAQFLQKLGFVALPASVRTLSEAQIRTIGQPQAAGK